LKSFVWADQQHRLELLDRAVATLREDPPELVRSDIAEALPDILARREPGALTVVWQTAVLGYLSDEDRGRVYEALEEAGRTEPLGWVSAGHSGREPEHEWALKIRLYPEEESAVVAYADYHGAWLEWVA
jgi:hypothetical protein